MDYIVEPKTGYTLDMVTCYLDDMGIHYKIINGSVILAFLTFDEVAALKDKAYCTHREHDDT